MHDTEYKSFYDERRNQTYSDDYKNMSAEDSANYVTLKEYIDKYALTDKTCLEIGSSDGFFQDMVQDYY